MAQVRTLLLVMCASARICADWKVFLFHEPCIRISHWSDSFVPAELATLGIVDKSTRTHFLHLRAL
jgi:hypothetical protein